ncbi:MAG: ABC transporter ATP-binding protein [Acidobacteriia bacterium]|nr:ABC transporter ATP-binding protein [Terriglobia bacterium]
MAYLTLRKLKKTYGATIAVEDFDLSVEAGEFVALLGPSGCGKTTTLRMIAGFVPPTAGEIWIHDADVTHLPAHRRNVGLVFQNYALFPHMTVRANIEFGLKAHHVDSAQADERVRSVLALVGLSSQEHRYPRELSGGQQQRVALARVLALKPDLLLFDEPLSNLDAKLRVQMRQEIRRLQREVGVTALFVTHDQEEAMTIADRIVVLDRGRIAQVGSPAEIYDRPQTRFVADFIGISNFFEGAPVSEAGRSVFRCESGLEISIPPENAPGAPGAMAVRPEKIEFVSADAPHSLPGIIRQAMQLGSTMEYLIELSSGDRVVVHEQKRPRVSIRQTGEQVRITWQPADSIFLQS